ncbi:MAG: hypothetical protein GY769_18575 [bacterium]|nr:hypothetical protein [bacterium]
MRRLSRTRLCWAKLICHVFEVDPLLWPFCWAEMKIFALILVVIVGPPSRPYRSSVVARASLT